MNRFGLFFAAASAVLLSSCVSISTHEKQMNACRDLRYRLDEAEQRITQLEGEKELLERRLQEREP